MISFFKKLQKKRSLASAPFVGSRQPAIKQSGKTNFDRKFSQKLFEKSKPYILF
jgi:hypothetical protein